MTDIAGWLHFFRQLTYMRYLVVSVAALAVDLGLFLLLLQMGMLRAWRRRPSGTASAFLSIGSFPAVKCFRIVFLSAARAERTQQKAMFVMSALLGLATTTAIVGGGEWIGTDPRVAKLVAIAISFQLTYLLRNVLIFRVTRTG